MSGRVPARTLWVGWGRRGRLAGAVLVRGGGEVHVLRRDVSGVPERFRAVRADLAHLVDRADPATVLAEEGAPQPLGDRARAS